MNQTGLLIALAVAVVAGLAFGLYPQLDLALVSPFYDPARLPKPKRLDAVLSRFG